MREKINKLARGIVDMEIPRIRLSNTSFAETIAAGECNQYELLLISENGVQLKGLIYSSHPKVRILKEAFGGMRTKLGFEVDSRESADGDVIAGNLDLVSNAGELKIPFSFTVERHPSSEVITALKTAEDYARLFSENEAEAVEIFDHEEFVLADFLKEARTMALYEGLRRSTDRRHAAAELLKALGQGSPAPEQEAMPLQDGEMSSAEEYRTYLQEVKNGSRETHLYEKLLAALPEKFSDRLPREVYLYFAYEQDMDAELKQALYYNVLQNFGRDDDIYLAMERRMQEYAVQELLKGEINDRLALIYDRMIYPEMIDRRIASVFPVILNSWRVVCSDCRMKKLILRYENFKREEQYPIRDGIAYVPLYMNSYVLLFEDAEGKRYASLPYESSRVMDKPSLEARCVEVEPEQPMLKLKRVSEYAARGLGSQQELELTEDVISGLDLSRRYREELNECILHYYEAYREEDAKHPFVGELSYLRSIRARRLSEKSRGILAETMIAFGEYTEAYELILRYGVQTLGKQSLEQLLSYMIDHAAEKKPAQLVLLGYRAFQQGSENGRIIAYLLRNFSGMSDDMQEILERAMKLQRRQAMEADKRRKAAEAEIEAKEREISEAEELRRARAENVRGKLREESRRISNTQKALERILKGAEKEESNVPEKTAVLASVLESWQRTEMPELPVQDRETALAEIRNRAAAEEDAQQDGLIRDTDILAMAERLLGQLLYTRETGSLDEVYDIYLLHDGHDFMLVRAYMTVRAIGYFLQQHSVRDSFFRDLYMLVRGEKNKDRVPLIYLLALTKYMSILRELSPEETQVLQSVMEVLLRKKLIFAYTKKLQRFIELPDYVTDKTYIEYHGERSDKPTLYVRILPDETGYHTETLERVYQNIFVAALTLFTGERADFQIRPMNPEKPVLKGCVEAGAPRKNHGDTYDILNEMSAVAEKGKAAELRDAMVKYAQNEAVIAALFAAEHNEKTGKGDQFK